MRIEVTADALREIERLKQGQRREAVTEEGEVLTFA